MEDQQLAEGDLTVEDRDEEAQADTVVSSAAEVKSTEKDETAEAESAEPGDTDADGSDTTEADGTEAETAKADTAKTAPAKKRTGRWAAALVALAAVLFVGSAAFAGATVQPYLAQRATVDVKLQVARAAANTITTLWSYNPTNMD